MRFFLSLVLLFILSPSSHADLRFLTISDIHYNGQEFSANGQDTGKELLNTTLKKFSQLAQQVDFMITLGDLPTHTFGYSPYKETYEKVVFQKLFAADTVGKPMFYVTGNNDSLQGNYKAFRWHDKSPLTLTSEWASACIYCNGLMVDKTHLQDGGYYTSYVLPNNKDILLIALNSVQFAKTPFYSPKYPNQAHEATIQLQWLAEQLKAHHAKQLLIAAHIPPGTNHKGEKLWQNEYLKKFIELLNTYEGNFEQITLLTSHTHMDDIRKIKLNKDRNIYLFSTPSISRIHHNHPAMKIFKLNNNLKISNFTTYYTTLNGQWQDEHYCAIDSAGSIFPQCKHTSDLATCLNTLDDQTVCKNLVEDLFYGTKSPSVDGSVCKLTYPVN